MTGRCRCARTRTPGCRPAPARPSPPAAAPAPPAPAATVARTPRNLAYLQPSRWTPVGRHERAKSPPGASRSCRDADLDWSDDRVRCLHRRAVLEVQLEGLSQIGEGFLDAVTLTGDLDFEAASRWGSAASKLTCIWTTMEPPRVAHPERSSCPEPATGEGAPSPSPPALGRRHRWSS